VFFRSVSVRPALVVAVLALLLSACADGERDEAREDPGGIEEEETVEEPEPEPEPEEADEPDEPEVDPADVGADELGRVPVLMYHQLSEDGGSEWDMSPEEFRSELEYLFDEGYVPITTRELARGEIDVPAGRTPVVLTFDDSTRSQARLTDDGEIDPESSIGILIEVAAEYEDVEPVASVYVISGSLFGERGDGEEIVEALHEAGMEIGNHSHTHPSLASLDEDAVKEELGRNVEVVTSVVDDAEIATLSLPLGQFPDDASLAVSGEWEGVSYEHDGVLLVGYDPAPSPFAAAFDAAAIPRIQTNVDPDHEFGSAWWLKALEEGRNVRRYVSDGDPERISFPKEFEDDLAEEHAQQANPY
jgi:hypothetical protein